MTTTDTQMITSTEQAMDATQTITKLRRKAAAFASYGVDDEAAALTATADELEARLEQWTTAQARERGAAVMDELHTIVRESRQREEDYIAVMVTLVRLQAEMRRALDRFCELRSIAAIGGQDVSSLGKHPQEPLWFNLDPSVHEDAAFAIRLGWNDPDAHRELARRREAKAVPPATSTRSSPRSWTIPWTR